MIIRTGKVLEPLAFEQLKKQLDFVTREILGWAPDSAAVQG